MLLGFQSLSAVDKNSAESYTKLMLALVMSYEYDFDADFRRKMTLWFKDSKKFMTRFKLPTKDFEKAYRSLLAEKDPNEDNAFDAAMDDAIGQLAAVHSEVKKEMDLSRADMSLLNDIRLMHVKVSPSARSRISKVVSRFREPDLNEIFIEEHDDISEELKELEAIVKRYTGKVGTVLPVPVMQQWNKIAKLKNKKLADHTRYNQLRATLNNTFKTRLKSLIRTSGKPYLPVHTVIESMDDEGISHNLPHEFMGNIDDAGEYYTKEGRQMKTKPSGKVIMNPAYDGKEDNAFVFTFQSEGKKEPGRAYTKEYAAKSKVRKFTVVTETIPKLDALARKWRADMKDIDSLEGVYATILEFVYVTNARSSNPNAQSAGSRTFGATQFQLKHMTIDDHKILVTYSGKSGGPQKHLVEYTKSTVLKLMAKNIQKLIKGKKKDDTVFTFKGKSFTSTQVSKYMKSIGFPKGFTVHVFRTAKGTKMAADIMKKAPFKKGGDWSEREVHAWILENLKPVGAELGHMSGESPTAKTAIKNYINPDILIDFYNKLGIKPSTEIQNAIDAAKKSG